MAFTSEQVEHSCSQKAVTAQVSGVAKHRATCKKGGLSEAQAASLKAEGLFVN